MRSGEEEEGGGGRTRRTSARSRASDIKSNNPHLAGGERKRNSIFSFFYSFKLFCYSLRKQFKKMKKNAALFFQLFFHFFFIAKGGALTQKQLSMAKLNDNGVFEAFFLATWAEAQSWTQLILNFSFFLFPETLAK